MDLSSADVRYSDQQLARHRRPSRRHWSQHLQDLNRQVEEAATSCRPKQSAKGHKTTEQFDSSKGYKRGYAERFSDHVPVAFEPRRGFTTIPQRGHPAAPEDPEEIAGRSRTAGGTRKATSQAVRRTGGHTPPGTRERTRATQLERLTVARQAARGDTAPSVNSSELGAATFVIKSSLDLRQVSQKGSAEHKASPARKRPRRSVELVGKNVNDPARQSRSCDRENDFGGGATPEITPRSKVSTRCPERLRIFKGLSKNQAKSAGTCTMSPSMDSGKSTQRLSYTRASGRDRSFRLPQLKLYREEGSFNPGFYRNPLNLGVCTDPKRTLHRTENRGREHADFTKPPVNVKPLKAVRTIPKSWSTTAEASTSMSRVGNEDWSIPKDEEINYLVPTAQSYDMSCGKDIQNIVYHMGSSDATSPDCPPLQASMVVSENTLLDNAPSATAAIPNEVEHVLVTKKEIFFYNAGLLLTLVTIGLFTLALYPKQSSPFSTPPEALSNQTRTAMFLDPFHASRAPRVHRPQSNLVDGSGNDLYRVCSTSACSRDGSFLSNLIVRDSDPCDDFYHFICSRWKSRYSDVEVAMPASSREELVFKLETDLRTLLMSPLPRGEYRLLSPLKNFVTACANTNDDGRNVDSLLEFLSAMSLEGFPYTPPIRTSVSIWKLAASALKLTGASALFTVGVSVHPFDAERDVLTVGLPESLLGNLGDGTSKNLTPSAYHRIVRSSINAIKKRFVPSSYVAQIVDFAVQVDQLVEKRNVQRYRVAALREIQDVATFLCEVVSEDLDDKTPVLLRAPEFVQELVKLVRQTDSHIIMNFLSVHTIIRTSVLFPTLDEDLTLVSTSLLFGTSQKVPRWRVCLRLAHHALPYLLLYASQAVVTTSHVLDAVRALLDDTRTLLIKKLDKLTIMDSPTRILAKRILAETRFQIFGPPWLRDREKLATYVSHLPNITTDGVLRSYSKAHSASLSFSLRLPSSDVWTGSAFETRCWHDLQLKAVFVPTLAFDFSLPVFDDMNSLQLPRGGVHIASCAFEMLIEGVSAHYNRDIVVRGWWTHTAKELLRKSRLCLQRQFGQDAPVRLLEDGAALSLVLDLYRNYVLGRTGQHADIRLPGVEDFGADHLFFIYFALGYCQTPSKHNVGMKDAFFRTFDVSNHRAQAIRCLNVTLGNTREFREAFGCRYMPQGTAAQTCLLWKS